MSVHPFLEKKVLNFTFRLKQKGSLLQEHKNVTRKYGTVEKPTFENLFVSFVPNFVPDFMHKKMMFHRRMLSMSSLHLCHCLFIILSIVFGLLSCVCLLVTQQTLISSRNLCPRLSSFCSVSKIKGVKAMTTKANADAVSPFQSHLQLLSK